MKPAQVVMRPLNEFGQVYVHVWPDGIRIFNMDDAVLPKVIPLPRRTYTPLEKTMFTVGVLRQMGWGLGVDGWRAPLNQKSPIIATAHIYRLEDMARFGR